MPGLTGEARRVIKNEPIDFWTIPIDHEIIEMIFVWTNEKITELTSSYNGRTFINLTDDDEIRVCISLLYLSGVSQVGK